MESTQFCYWLQGFFEIANPSEITAEQTEIIKNHLNLVFFHDIDPKASSDPKIQEKMNEIHSGKIEPYHSSPSTTVLRC
jgi:hypothetical protein